ncbi:hypothetical protein MNEG_8766 [Monoraphidium neglectum]|uniref:Crossover junction endonuclease MUS81 n=1 Tax=Monoraphidium neglectum TaxID=145388 RepID=A0A0D2M765_9CHLO|nr:hypothetical protein MNEG_8766 [Monoraphidium neglectum]KIY99199.1 hypothetical protein MNEG_8766 [Monoraphidium neglectum]|eukprot:XP_013898219.1 hypothetical protein MNEG_8766 [Monoraphidium neglectum]
MQRPDDAPLSKSLPGALRSLSGCAYRVCAPEQLLLLKGFGPKTVKIIMEVLWSVSPPDEEDEEEREFRQLCEAEAKAEAKAHKAAAKAAAAPAPAPAPVPVAPPRTATGSGAPAGARAGGVAAPRVASHDPLEALRSALGESQAWQDMAQRAVALAGAQQGTDGGAPPAQQRPQQARKRAAAGAEGGGGGAGGAGGVGGGEAAARKKPRAKPTGGPKLPAPGTGNYAVLVVLYMSYKRGEACMLKESVLDAATAHAGLCDVSMRPSNAWSASAKDRYNGWSNVNVRGGRA